MPPHVMISSPSHTAVWPLRRDDAVERRDGEPVAAVRGRDVVERELERWRRVASRGERHEENESVQ